MKDSRPYNTDGMTSERWRDVPVVTIPIEWIKPSQGYVSIHILKDIFIGRYKDAYGHDPYPHVVLSDGYYWLEDGHHRYVISLLAGETEIDVRIISSSDV